MDKPYEILDVGCGFESHNKPLTAPNTIHVDIRKSDFNKPFLDICCDGFYLPFRDKSFKVIYISHVLEHTLNPLLFLKEMKRVAETVIVKVPRLSLHCDYECTNHFFTWSKKSLQNLPNEVFNDVEIKPNLSGFNKFPFFKRTFNLFTYFALTILTKNKPTNELVAICK